MNQETVIIQYFTSLKAKGQLGPGYLFLGHNEPLVKRLVQIAASSCTDGCSICQDCKQFAASTHPDFMLLEAEGVSIKVEQIRDAIQFLSMKSFSAPRKVLMLKDAKSLNITSANAFLKTLEEPPANSIIFILADSLDGLLPTIVSRCRKIFLPPAHDARVVIDPSDIESFLSGEKMKFNDRKDFLSFLTGFAALLRGQLMDGLGVNNPLPGMEGCEIILPSWDMEKICRILDKTLAMQAVYNSVNENLAINLIRMETL